MEFVIVSENEFVIVSENQIALKFRYIESIHSMRKPVISSEISPKFDGLPTTYILPISEIISIINMLRYVLHTCNRGEDSQRNLNG